MSGYLQPIGNVLIDKVVYDIVADMVDGQKVPATILSRCQRYDFTRIGPEDIARRVEYIAGEEKLELFR